MKVFVVFIWIIFKVYECWAYATTECNYIVAIWHIKELSVIICLIVHGVSDI